VGGCFRPQISNVDLFKHFSYHPFKSGDASTLRFLEVNSASASVQTREKLGLRLATGTGKLPGPKENWVCGLPQGQESCPDRRKIGSAACHRDRKAARTEGKLGLGRATGTGNFSFCIATKIYDVFSGLLPHKRKSRTGFIRWSPAGHQWGQRINFLFIYYR
jgi:hypothetical protein